MVGMQQRENIMHFGRSKTCHDYNGNTITYLNFNGCTKTHHYVRVMDEPQQKRTREKRETNISERHYGRKSEVCVGEGGE